jgi:RNA-directed DNA polymerase
LEMPEPMGMLDTVEVNGPEGEVLDWDAADWRRVEDEVRRLRQRIFTATQEGDLSQLTSLRGLLEPVAWKAGTAGS